MSAHRALHEWIRVEECAVLFPALRPLLAGEPRILEVGAGNGVQSVELARLGPVFAVDPSVKPRAAARVAWLRAAAERLPFADGVFDVVYSSSVVEHLERLDEAMAELRRVARPGALHVHVVPTHVWKLLSVGSHYGALARSIWRRLSGRRRAAPPRADLAEWRPPVSGSRWRRLLPEVHGTSASNRAELRAFHPSSWRALFAAHGLEVIAVHPLLCYAPPEWPFVPPNRLGARLGLSSSTAFVMR